MCYYHTSLPANRICSRCGRRICVSCAKPYGDLILCPTCFHMSPMINATPQASSTTRSGSNAQSGSDAKPHTPHRRTIIILLSISAALIWINADLLLWWPAFYATWVGLFPWVAQLGNLGFILGVILGLVIDMGAIAYSFGGRFESAFMVFPAAIISLLIGGGFLAGLIIAVLTGIFIVMNEKVSQNGSTTGYSPNHQNQSSTELRPEFNIS